MDVYHTSTHGVALVRIYNAGLKSAARGSLETQDSSVKFRGNFTLLRAQKIAKNSSSAHYRTTLLSYIFSNKSRIDNPKNMLNSNISSTYSHNMVNFGLLAAEIDCRVWGTPANFNGFRVLDSLLQRRR